MKKRLIFCLMLALAALAVKAAQGVYYVEDFGARGDGKTLDHAAINKAIETASAHGGGQVVLSPGTYLCGSIRLKSNVDLHLTAGAKILAAPAKLKAYDESETFGGPEYQDGGHTYFHNSLIWAEGQQNVSITGHGMIDGEGLTKRDTEKAGNVQGGSIGTGDKAIALKLCRNVTIRDITIFRGGHFAIIVTGCDIGTIDNVTIDTNRDGIDIDCCKYFTVSNTKVNTPNDDAIVLKSSYALKRPVMCEHILITNCIVTGYKLGSFLDGTYVPEQVNWVCGRIKLGTESNGGYRNITISNCSCMWSSGLAFEEVDQGRMENIVVSNISLSHVHHYPIYITTGCRNRGPAERTDVSSARDIYINNVVADDCDSLAGIIVTGMAGTPIRNVSLSNIRIQYRGGGKNVSAPYREQGTNYPEPRWAGPTPAYGLFARHVDGLHLQNVTFELMRPDERPDIILEDVTNYTNNSPTGKGSPAWVLLTAGQSNADGRVEVSQLPSYIQENGFRYCQWSYGSGDFCEASGDFETFSPTIGRTNLGPRWGFDAVVYYELEKQLQRPFYVIKQTMGGTAIDTLCSSTHGKFWSADACFLARETSASKGGRSLLKAFTEQIDACIEQQLSKLPEGYDIKAMLWHQGESDRQQADRYFDNMKEVVAYVRAYLVKKTGMQKYAHLPVVCGTFSKNSRQGSLKVVEALRRLEQEDPDFHVVDASDATLQQDKIHFDAAGAELLGKRVFEKLRQLKE